MSGHTAGRRTRPPAPRTPPRARPAAVVVAVLLALALIAVAVVAVRDLALAQGWATGTPWIRSVLNGLDGLGPSTGLAVVGALVGIVGLLLMWLGLRPGRRTHLRGPGDADLWLSRGAVAALAQSTADRVAGVVSADASRTSRRRIIVDVVASANPDADTRSDPQAVTERVRTALEADIAPLTGASIKVRTTEVPR